jgi:polyhydroxyalkanoate synthesis regulator phasin
MTIEEDSWNSSISGVTIQADNINSIIAAYNELNKLKAEGLELDEDSYNYLKLHLAQIVGIDNLDIADTLFAFDEEMQIRDLIQQTAGGDIGSITAPDYNKFTQAVKSAAEEQKLNIEETQRIMSELFPEYQTAEDRFINHVSHNVDTTIERLSDLARTGKLTTSDITESELMPSIDAMGVTADEATVYFRRLAEAILETGIASIISGISSASKPNSHDACCINSRKSSFALSVPYASSLSRNSLSTKSFLLRVQRIWRSLIFSIFIESHPFH